MAETEEELQRKVINWQEALRKGGLKMNTQKSKVLVAERHGETEVKVVDGVAILVELKQVKRFKYLSAEIATEGGATEGGATKAVKQRIKMA